MSDLEVQYEWRGHLIKTSSGQNFEVKVATMSLKLETRLHTYQVARTYKLVPK